MNNLIIKNMKKKYELQIKQSNVDKINAFNGCHSEKLCIRPLNSKVETITISGIEMQVITCNRKKEVYVMLVYIANFNF